jgi:UDP-3-O-[3-hydroxymyristoyl] glucosamine N-acyltransferase
MAVTLAELAEHIGAELHGDGTCTVGAVAALERAGHGDVSFLQNRAFRKFLKVTGASAVILGEEFLRECPVAALVMEDAYLGYARAAGLLHPHNPRVPGIDPAARIEAGAMIASSASVGAFSVVEAGARIGEEVEIGPNCFIGRDASVDACTCLGAGVTICHGVTIGRRCIIQAGAVIGADGFGLARDRDRWIKIPQIGGVRLGDDVEIGANTTIDRGALEDTIIENGVKIDNLVQVAHNVRIGEHTAIAACVGISGSVVIGKRCMLAGGVGIAGHLEIADDVVVTGMSMVTKSITEAGTYSGGWAAQVAPQWRRNVAALRRLGRRPPQGNGTAHE